MSRFLFGFVLGAASLYVAMHYHVVRTDDGVHLVAKISNNLSDVYVDVRDYRLDDWRAHKPLAAAMMQSRHRDVLSDAALDGFRSSVGDLVQGLWGRD